MSEVPDYGLPEAPSGWFWFLGRAATEGMLALRLLRHAGPMGLSRENQIDEVYGDVEFDATPEDLLEVADEVMDAWRRVAGDPPHLTLGKVK